MKFSFVIICCVVDFIYFVETSNLSQFSNDFSIISKAVSEFISHAYFINTPKVNICSAPINDDQKLATDDLINEVVMQSESVFQIEQYSFLNASNEKRFHNVILISNYASFRQIYNCLLADNFAYQGYFLFVLIDYYKEQVVEMHQVIRDLWEIYIVNVNILMKNKVENVLDMMTYHPFYPKKCGQAYPVYINQFKNSKFEKPGKFFVDTLENMNQCPLRVASFNIAPFMMIKYTNDSFILDGIDGFLLTGNN